MASWLLVPTDGSPPARRAVDRATELAGKLGKPILGLYVIETGHTDGYPEFSVLPTEDMYEKHWEKAQQMLKKAFTPAQDAGVEVKMEVVRAENPWTGILDAAEEGSVDMIVMGSHGRGGLRRFLLGSVAERVARAAPCPVMLVPSEDRSP